MTYKADFIMARHFDYVFASQKDGAVRFRHDGIVNAVWLPFGCDPEIHAKSGSQKIYDVAFIGSDGWGRRRRLLERLKRRFPNSYIGRASHTEIGKIYSQAKIVFNCNIFNDLNMRVFEALCSGSCLVTNSDDSGLTDLFIAGKHLLTYSSEDEAISVIEHYLANDAEREGIAQAGRDEVLHKHTYFHRVRTIMETVFSENEQRPRRPDDSWFAQRRDAFYLKTLEQVYKVDYHLRKWFA
jgi:spore maturation protein CgeB